MPVLLALLALLAVGCTLPAPPYALEYEATATAEQIATVETAASAWNEALGRRAFVRAGELEGVDVIRVVFRPRTSHLVGYAHAERGSDVYSVTLRDNPSVAVAAHELGHTLRLADIDNPESVMHHNDLVTATRILPSDVDEVRSIWGW